MCSTDSARLRRMLLVIGLAVATVVLACNGGTVGGESSGPDGGATASTPPADGGADAAPDADAGPKVCTPETYVYCRCTDGGVGTKKCVDGYFEPCICE